MTVKQRQEILLWTYSLNNPGVSCQTKIRKPPPPFFKNHVIKYKSACKEQLSAKDKGNDSRERNVSIRLANMTWHSMGFSDIYSRNRYLLNQDILLFSAQTFTIDASIDVTKAKFILSLEKETAARVQLAANGDLYLEAEAAGETITRNPKNIQQSLYSFGNSY